MQTGKKAIETVKEKALNAGVSAKSGIEKTKATLQEKVDKMRAHNDYEKGLATVCKQERIVEAENRKQQALAHKEAQKEAQATIGN
ncbi:hypothetical protein vseg_014409 [Gypsophila vaccaria]